MIFLLLIINTGLKAETLAQMPIGWVDGSGGEISNLAELRWLSETQTAWDEVWTVTKDIDASETATWNAGEGFSPIGNNAVIQYSGIFEGNNHIISNLTINRPTLEHCGFFGFVNGNNASISDLMLSNCNITGKAIVGGIAGKIKAKALVINCSVSGKVTSVESHAGMLVGYNWAESKIYNCHSSGTVKGTAFLGGLVGYNDNLSIIKNCYSTANVEGTSSTLGGFVGFNYNSSVVENCFSMGSVNGGSVGEYVGGFVGRNVMSSTIKNSYSTGAVSANAKKGAFAGGNLTSSTITNCYFDSNLSLLQNSVGDPFTNILAVPLTTSQFEIQSNFVGFDFTRNWSIRSLSETDGSIRPSLNPGNILIIRYYTLNNNNKKNLFAINATTYNSTASIITAASTILTVPFVGWISSDNNIITKLVNLSLTKVISDTSVFAYYTSISSQIISQIVGNGTVSNNNQIVYKNLHSVPLVATASVGYHFVNWKDNTGTVISTNTSLTFKNVTSDISITATFEKNKYTVSFVNMLSNFSIASQQVAYGESTTAVTAFTPQDHAWDYWYARNYNASTGLYDITLLTTDNTIILTNVVSDTTIYTHQTFNAGTVSFTTDGNGTILGENPQMSYPYGTSTVAVSAIPNVGYEFNAWLNSNGDTVSKQGTDFSFVFQKTSLCPIKAVFKKKQLSVSYLTIIGGYISGDSVQTVEYNNASQSVTAINNDGSYFVCWLNSNGDTISKVNPLILNNVTTDTSLIAHFEKYKYKVTFTANANGSITGNKNQLVNSFDFATSVFAQAQTGYKFSSWKNNAGTVISNVNPLQFGAVTSDTTIVAFFELDVFANEQSAISIQIKPNPATNYIEITAEAGSKITIVNTLGEIQKTAITTPESGILVVDLNSYLTGIYVVTVTNGTNSVSKMFVVQK